jgi:hypothetical protein
LLGFQLYIALDFLHLESFSILGEHHWTLKANRSYRASTMFWNLLLLFAVCYLFTSVLAVDRTINPDLDAKLNLAATNLDRYAILSNPSDWVFDFKPKTTFHPGSVVNANAATFPALTGLGMTLAMLNLGPCAMLPPHSHPRATNVVVAVQGNTTTWMVNENGVDVVQAVLTPGLMTIFPQGSLHSMQNQGIS